MIATAQKDQGIFIKVSELRNLKIMISLHDS